MDDRRWASIRHCRDSYLGGRTEVLGEPQEAYFEVAARCNLRCVMCPLPYSPDHLPGGSMPALLSPEIFARLRPLFPTLVRAYLFGLGEPLLHGGLGGFVRELSGAGAEVWLTTNATLMDRRRAEELVDAGIDRISVSADGATAATFEAIRHRGRFADLMRGLEALSSVAGRRGRPHLTVNFVAMASNLHELPAMARLCGEHGVAELNVEPLFDWQAMGPEMAAVYRRETLGRLDPRRVEATLAEAAVAAEEAGVALRNQRPAATGNGHGSRSDPGSGHGTGNPTGNPTGNGSGDRLVSIGATAGETVLPPCTEPWSTISVSAAGDVSTCCLNGRSFGNLARQSFDEIWNGGDYRAFRRHHTDGTAAPGCDPCLDNGRQRLSPFFVAAAGGTVRPLLAAEESSPPPFAPRLDRPRDGETVTDPMVVTGRLGRRGLHRLLAPDSSPWPALRLDAESHPALAGAVVDGGRFVAILEVPYLSEGAHVLSLGGDRLGAPGWSRRTVYFRRPPADDAVLAATRRVAVGRLLPRPIRRASVRLGGRPWPAARWYCGRRQEGWSGVAVADLRGLAAGGYDLEIEPEGLPPATYRLLRLAE